MTDQLATRCSHAGEIDAPQVAALTSTARALPGTENVRHFIAFGLVAVGRIKAPSCQRRLLQIVN